MAATVAANQGMELLLNRYYPEVIDPTCKWDTTTNVIPGQCPARVLDRSNGEWPACYYRQCRNARGNNEYGFCDPHLYVLTNNRTLNGRTPVSLWATQPAEITNRLAAPVNRVANERLRNVTKANNEIMINAQLQVEEAVTKFNVQKQLYDARIKEVNGLQREIQDITALNASGQAAAIILSQRNQQLEDSQTENKRLQGLLDEALANRQRVVTQYEEAKQKYETASQNELQSALKNLKEAKDQLVQSQGEVTLINEEVKESQIAQKNLQGNYDTLLRQRSADEAKILDLNRQIEIYKDLEERKIKSAEEECQRAISTLKRVEEELEVTGRPNILLSDTLRDIQGNERESAQINERKNPPKRRRQSVSALQPISSASTWQPPPLVSQFFTRPQPPIAPLTPTGQAGMAFSPERKSQLQAPSTVLTGLPLLSSLPVAPAGSVAPRISQDILTRLREYLGATSYLAASSPKTYDNMINSLNKEFEQKKSEIKLVQELPVGNYLSNEIPRYNLVVAQTSASNPSLKLSPINPTINLEGLFDLIRDNRNNLPSRTGEIRESFRDAFTQK